MARRDYFKSLISNSASKPRKLWSSLNSLLNRTNASPSLPSSTSSQLPDNFLKFFSDKISKLNSSLIPDSISPHTDPATPPPILSNFSLATQDEVRRAILFTSDSTCSLDFLPTCLLKSCLDVLLVPITNLINLCILESTVPAVFKHALITPLPKKNNLPIDDLSNYRPISNLNFLSKVLERIIHDRLLTHLNSFASIPSTQSAYRKFHSVETALLKIQNDLLLAMDKKQVSALLFLDLSAAFDTVDHNILLHRLSSYFGVQHSALDLLSSYLLNRTQAVIIGNTTSQSSNSFSGVPQGSVLGPLLFSLYTTPLARHLHSSGLSHHMYADDTQLYISFSANDSTNSLSLLSYTLDSIHSWLTRNRLSLNPSKTEFLIVGSAQQRNKLNFSSLSFCGNSIPCTSKVRNLGVLFDSDLSYDAHISLTCRSSYHQIRQIRQIRSSLDRNTSILLANSLVSSKLDFCNSLYFNLPQKSIQKLQLVQNSLVRVVTPSVRKYDHVSSAMKDLHWLPVEKRIIFKIATLTFKALQQKSPTYLSNLITVYKPTRVLRSSSQLLLAVPSIKSSAGRRSFSFAAPKVWNSLPLNIRSSTSLTSFRSSLKTFLFPP